MPFQLLPQEQAGFGANFGTGLGQGLAYLAQNKLQQLTKGQELAKRGEFWKKIGLPGVEHQPEAVQKALLDRLEGFDLGGSQQQPQQPQMLDQLLGRQEGFSPTEFEQALAAYQEPEQSQQLQGGFKIGPNPMERRHREALEQQERLAREKQEIQGQEKVQPFLHAQAQDFNNAKKIASLSKKMLTNLERNRAKWPGVFKGYLPTSLQRDPDVRKYIADSNQLVTLLAGSRRGQPTNFKIRLEQASKPELTQPIETQEAILRDLLTSSDEVFNTQKEISKIKEANGGKYPRDLETRLAEIKTSQLEQPQPTQLAIGDTVKKLPHAELYPNAEIEAPNGEILVSDGKKWKKKGK